MIGLGFEPRPSAINLVLLHTSLCPSSKPPCEKCGQTFPLHREGNQGPERSRNSPKVMRQEVTELELGLRPVCPVLSSELVSTVPRTLPQTNPSQSQVSPDKSFLFISHLQTGLWGGAGTRCPSSSSCSLIPEHSWQASTHRRVGSLMSAGVPGHLRHGA